MVKETSFQPTEIGAIPKDWECLEFKNLFQFKQGVQTPIEQQIKTERSGYKQFIRIVDLTNPSEPPRYVPDPGSSHHIRTTDLFMVRYGSPGLVGYQKEGVIANNLFRLLPKREIDSSFYYQYLGSRQQHILEISGSSTMPAISFSTLGSLKIVYLSLKEQRAIAKVLLDIDSTIFGLEKLIAKKRDIKQATMQQLLTRKTRLSGFKADWITARLDSIIEVLTDYTANGSFESLKNNVQYFETRNYSALVRTTDLGKRKFEPERFTDKKGYNFLSKTALYGGELILANVGSIGKVFRVPHFDMPMTLAPNTYLIKFTSNIDQEFMCQYLNTDMFYKKLMSQVGSSTLQAINKQNLRSIEIVIPSGRDEQEAISKILVSQDLDLEASIRKLEKLKLLKQGMMQELLTGRIRLL